MPSIRETRKLPYSAEQMFDLVADVAKYPLFLPWVVATRVRDESETELEADMLVGFKAVREKFTSKVELERPNTVRVHYIDGPLRDLDNVWTFKPADDGGCEIDFCVDFTFKNLMFEALAGQYFDRAFRKMVAAFEQRAEDLYGNSNSSAQSVA
ncbi:type II toxin-antitoxin system RatA family toxin [Alteraurantiacibacter aquimixticola]|uniref:Type II toxin-antitoxin system RatA family toxin n=1 Tax=Alteraurantiacibacter aquimixticola TaxID=2489173 RepID=A0A4T3F3F8_9SPHN|nr:type II toxin-antitoxin system RatA family toxin [Alteraurantiacibacter aquimixticola]TIX50038.1 type II toxin-antitoxin system RatA family toxin [Alteraurantiacibacter aquimixticola]